MTDISRHPVLKQAYDVCQAIEKCGASPELTAAVTKASDLLQTLGVIYDTTEAQVHAVSMTEYGLRDLQTVIHQQNVDMGWWDNPREDGTLMMLMVSEIVEAMEGTRKNLMDDHLPHRKMEEVELADAVIRILDYAGAKGFDIAGALVEKLVYNRSRADHQRENRGKENGKKF